MENVTMRSHCFHSDSNLLSCVLLNNGIPIIWPQRPRILNIKYKTIYLMLKRSHKRKETFLLKQTWQAQNTTPTLRYHFVRLRLPNIPDDSRLLGVTNHGQWRDVSQVDNLLLDVYYVMLQLCNLSYCWRYGD